MSRAFTFFTDFSCFIMIETQHNINNILTTKQEENNMTTLLGFTMIMVGISRLATGGFLSGIIFTAWGIRILKKAAK